MSLVIQSAAFSPGKPIPKRHSGDGEDLSPALSWTALPSGARELALIVDDPDAPTAEPWVHWVLYNVPATVQGIEEGVHQADRPPFPDGASQGLNSWNTIGYRGPAPPKGHGVHHYYFKLYALDAPLKLLAGLDKKALLKAMVGHVLDQGELIGTYERPR